MPKSLVEWLLVLISTASILFSLMYWLQNNGLPT
jgi:hypothetical protein